MRNLLRGQRRIDGHVGAAAGEAGVVGDGPEAGRQREERDPVAALQDGHAPHSRAGERVSGGHARQPASEHHDGRLGHGPWACAAAPGSSSAGSAR